MFGFDPNDKTKHQNFQLGIVAGALAGAPAAFSHLLMLLKTRLQVAGKNEAKYKKVF